MAKFLNWYEKNKTYNVNGNKRNRYNDEQMKKLDYVLDKYSHTIS